MKTTNCCVLQCSVCKDFKSEYSMHDITICRKCKIAELQEENEALKEKIRQLQDRVRNTPTGGGDIEICEEEGR